ncbi:MAG: hypothetical protein WDN04_11740 [Rhodospirillales bacterium]
MQIRYALAKEYEDLREYPRSFAHLAAGATLRRHHLRYDVADDVATIGRIIATFGPEYLAAAAPPAGNDAARSSCSACRAPAPRSSSASSAATTMSFHSAKSTIFPPR